MRTVTTRTETALSDLEKINAAAEWLNAEMEDVLRYQAPIDWDSERPITDDFPEPKE